MYLLQELKRIRKSAGYTLRRLESKSGIACSTISKLENLRREAQRKTAKRLADALEVEVEDLVGVEFPSFAEIEPPAFTLEVLSQSDDAATIKAYEMQEFILLVRRQLGKCSLKIGESLEASGTGWRVTVFHPSRWAWSSELNAATRVVPDPDMTWFSGLPAGGFGEPHRTTLMSVQDTNGASDAS